MSPGDPGRPPLGRRLGIHLRQGLQDRRSIGVDFQVGFINPPELRRIRVDMNQRLVRFGRLGNGVALRGHISQPGADCDDQVRLVQGPLEIGRHVEGHVRGEIRVHVVEQVLMAPADGDGHLPRLADRPQGVPPAALVDLAAGDQQRALGGGEPLGDPGDLPVGGRRQIAIRARRRRRAYVIEQHILGQRNDHRAGRPAFGDGERLRRLLGEPFGVRHLDHMLGHAAEEALVVDFLERHAAEVRAGHLPDEQNQGDRILLRDVNADGCIGRAGPPADHGDPGPSGHLGVRDAHQGCARLMAGGHDVDMGGVVQGVDNREIALAGNAKDPVDPV